MPSSALPDGLLSAAASALVCHCLTSPLLARSTISFHPAKLRITKGYLLRKVRGIDSKGRNR